MVGTSIQLVLLLLAADALALSLLLLIYLAASRHNRRWYWSLPGLLTFGSGLLFWVLPLSLLPPAYCVTLCFFGLLAALLLPWLALAPPATH